MEAKTINNHRKHWDGIVSWLKEFKRDVLPDADKIKKEVFYKLFDIEIKNNCWLCEEAWNNDFYKNSCKLTCKCPLNINGYCKLWCDFIKTCKTYNDKKQAIQIAKKIRDIEFKN